MMKLQKSTDFAGEASAAAAMIDKLCEKHGITLKEATEVIINDDVFSEFKRMNSSYAVLLNSVANFYDAVAYISQKGDQKEFKVLGSEAQQIQVQLYFEYLMEVMNRECNLAYKGEKVLCKLTEKEISRSFKTNFKKAFAYQIQNRLKELKQKENRVHEDREAVQKAVSMLRFNNTRKFTGATGAGASVGAEAGSSVSLNRQTNGSNVQHALCGV